MRRLLLGLIIILGMAVLPNPAKGAAPTQPTVKDIAVAFGEALVHNDGGAAMALLTPELRHRASPSQLPSILGVQRPPQKVHVVRWAYNGVRGDATIGLIYPDRTVGEQLFMHLLAEGWRISAIVPEDPLTLQRAAEAAVVSFCDAAVRGDLRTMRGQLTDRLSARTKDAQLPSLLGLAGHPVAYTVLNYSGSLAGANVTVRLRSDTAVVTDLFEVINDRDGWRIAAILAA